MTFVIQKILWLLILPPSGQIILILAGLLLLNRHRPIGKALIVAGLTLLYVLSLGHTADLILKPLEGRYLPLKDEKTAVDAVVVPGGGSVDLAWLDVSPVPNAETLSRLITGVELSRKFRLPLIVCGGNGEPFSTKANDADAMALAAYAMDIPRGRVIAENVSRNTLENSYAVRKLVKGDRIILVTSAYHMRRASAMFGRRGFLVIPAPSYFLGRTRVCSLASLIPRASDLTHSSVGIAEWISLAWWGIRGEI